MPAPAEPLLFVFDAHCDVVQAVCDRGVDLGRRQAATHFDLPRARSGGVRAQVLALFVDPSRFKGEPAWRRTRQMLTALERTAAAHPGRFALVRSAGAVRDGLRAGQVCGLLGLEGAHGLGTSEPRKVRSRLEWLMERGLRVFGLTWNNSNALAGAAVDGGGGLTRLGREVVGACQRHGVLVDLSHSSDETARDVLRVSRAPVFASHSNARALCEVPRNLPDDLLRAIGRAGGMVCANFYPGFLDARAFRAIAAGQAAFANRFEELERRFRTDPAGRMLAERRLARSAMREVPRVPLARVVDHLLHLLRTAGEGAVGLGADFDGMLLTPVGLEDVRCYPRLAQALRRRGVADEVVRGLMGENLLGLLERAEERGAR
ncbi:MAG: membrane dipeptidase [Myxococcales bacterium]